MRFQTSILTLAFFTGLALSEGRRTVKIVTYQQTEPTPKWVWAFKFENICNETQTPLPGSPWNQSEAIGDYFPENNTYDTNLPFSYHICVAQEDQKNDGRIEPIAKTQFRLEYTKESPHLPIGVVRNSDMSTRRDCILEKIEEGQFCTFGQ